jgi:dTDP-4-amino-4,6-dideoxygalactose transaminase
MLNGVGDVATPQVRSQNEHIYHQYTIRTSSRDQLVEHLKKSGIPTAIHYPIPLHLQPAFSFLGLKPGSLPVAEKAAAEVVSLPIYPEIPSEQQDAVGNAIMNFYK